MRNVEETFLMLKRICEHLIEWSAPGIFPISVVSLIPPIPPLPPLSPLPPLPSLPPLPATFPSEAFN